MTGLQEAGSIRLVPLIRIIASDLKQEYKDIFGVELPLGAAQDSD